MDTTVEKRKDQLSEINSFIEQVDKELTLVLQKFNWDRKHVLQAQEMVICQYDSNHRIPVSRRDTHEQQCFLKKHGYHKDDKFLPEPPLDSQCMIKFEPQEINQIIEDAARKDPLFKRGYYFEQLQWCCHPFVNSLQFDESMAAKTCVKPQKFSIGKFKEPFEIRNKFLDYSSTNLFNRLRGVRGSSPEPLTADRLQCVYTSDERRALYDAVVATAPTQHVDDVTDLTLPGSSSKPRRVVKSREEVLAELRDMKRRRTKYRVAPKTKNYSIVLRDVIQAQMESYNEAQAKIKIKQEKIDDGYDDHGNSRSSHTQDFTPDKSYFKKYDNRRYTEERRSERYKEPSKRYEREDHREENKERYRGDYERVIKVEKDDEWRDKRKNDEEIVKSSSKERSKGEKYRPEISNRYHAEYRTSSKYDERYKREKERDEKSGSKYSHEREDKHKSDSSKDDSYKRHKKDKKKTSERNYERDEEYYRYRHDKDSSIEKRDKRSETISKDRREKKRKHESQEYGHVSYYNQYDSKLQGKTYKE